MSYEFFDFCRALRCPHFKVKNKYSDEYCDRAVVDLCPLTAKEVFRWLKQNKFKVVKDE